MLPTISPDHQHKIYRTPGLAGWFAGWLAGWLVGWLAGSRGKMKPVGRGARFRAVARVANEFSLGVDLDPSRAFANGRDCSQFSGEQLFTGSGHLVGARSVNE